MSVYPKEVWDQLKGKTIQDIQAALNKDSDNWEHINTSGATERYESKNNDHHPKEVTLHIHPKKTMRQDY